MDFQEMEGCGSYAGRDYYFNFTSLFGKGIGEQIVCSCAVPIHLLVIYHRVVYKYYHLFKTQHLSWGLHPAGHNLDPQFTVSLPHHLLTGIIAKRLISVVRATFFHTIRKAEFLPSHSWSMQDPFYNQWYHCYHKHLEQITFRIQRI